MADINDQLIYAVECNNFPLVQQLVANGADVNYRTNYGYTPLHYAKCLDIVQYLVMNNAYVNCLSGFGNYTPLYFAETLEIVQYLVANGADVNCQDKYGCTPLFTAKSLDIMKYLIANGADVNCQNNNGDTPLHINCYNINKSKILLEYGADMHITNNKNISAYEMGIKSRNLATRELFEQYNTLSNGLDIKEPCN